MAAKVKRLTQIAALLRDGDWRALFRQAHAKLTGRWASLPAGLAPHPRPASRVHKISAEHAKRLLAVCPSFRRDGAPISQFELCVGLKDRGWDVVALAPEDGPLRADYDKLGLKTHICNTLKPSPSVFSTYEKNIAAIATYLKGFCPSVVLASTVDCFPAIDASYMAGINSVWNIRESEPWRTRLADRNPAIAARALAAFDYPEAVIYVAQASQTRWEQFSPTTQKALIYNAPFETPFPDCSAEKPDQQTLRQRFGWHDVETVLLSVGTICPRKGQEDLINALNHMSADDLAKTRAIFIGACEDAYLQQIKATASSATWARCDIVGPVDNPLEYITASDFLVNTSRSEAFPRVFLEAARLKRPIIATPVDGAAERLVDGVSAQFYQPGDSKQLGDLIKHLRKAPNKTHALTTQAYKALVEKWTYKNMIDAYETILLQSARTETASGAGRL